ncbi:hypothetical protein RUND412_002785 [Rhizina undulata]
MTINIKYIHPQNEATRAFAAAGQRAQMTSPQPSISSVFSTSNSPIMGSNSPPLDQSILEQHLKKFMSEKRGQGQVPMPVMGRPRKLSKSRPWIIPPPGGRGSPAIATSSTYFRTDGPEPRIVTRTELRPVPHRNSPKSNSTSPVEPVLRLVGTRSAVESGWKPDLASHQRNDSGRRNSSDLQYLVPNGKFQSRGLERSPSIRGHRRMSRPLSTPPTPPAKDYIWPPGLLSPGLGRRPESMVHVDSPLLPPPITGRDMQSSYLSGACQRPQIPSSRTASPPLIQIGGAGKTAPPTCNQGINEEKDVAEKKSKVGMKKDKKFSGKSATETMVTKFTRIANKKDPSSSSSSTSGGNSSVTETIANKLFHWKQESKSSVSPGRSHSRLSASMPSFDSPQGNAAVKTVVPTTAQPWNADSIQGYAYQTQETPSLASSPPMHVVVELPGSFPEPANLPPKNLSSVFEGTDSAIDVNTPLPFSNEDPETKSQTAKTAVFPEAPKSEGEKPNKNPRTEKVKRKRLPKENSVEKFRPSPPPRISIYENLPLPAVPESKYSPSLVPSPLFRKTPAHSKKKNYKVAKANGNVRRLSLTIPSVGRNVAPCSPIKETPSQTIVRESFNTPDSSYDIIEWFNKLYKDPDNLPGTPNAPMTPRVIVVSPGTEDTIDTALRASILNEEGAVRALPAPTPTGPNGGITSISANRLSVVPRSSVTPSELERTSCASSVGDNFKYEFFGMELGAIGEEFELAPVGENLGLLHFGKGEKAVESEIIKVRDVKRITTAVAENVYAGSDDENSDGDSDMEFELGYSESIFEYDDLRSPGVYMDNTASADALQSEIEAMLASKRPTPRNSQMSLKEGSIAFFIDSDYDYDDAPSTGGLLDTEIEAILASGRNDSFRDIRLTALEDFVLGADEFMEWNDNEVKKGPRGTMYISGRNSQVEGDIIFCLKPDFL